MRFFRQEYWIGLLLPLPGDIPNPGIEPASHTLQADYLTFEPSGKPPYNSTSKNKTHIQSDLIPSDTYSEVGLLDHMIVKRIYIF